MKTAMKEHCIDMYK